MTKKILTWTMFVRAFMLSLFAGSTGGAHGETSAPTDDKSAWTYALSMGTAAALREYLRSFPTGTYVDEAIAMLISLGELEGAVAAPFARTLATPDGTNGTAVSSLY